VAAKTKKAEAAAAAQAESQAEARRGALLKAAEAEAAQASAAVRAEAAGGARPEAEPPEASGDQSTLPPVPSLAPASAPVAPLKQRPVASSSDETKPSGFQQPPASTCGGFDDDDDDDDDVYWDDGDDTRGDEHYGTTPGARAWCCWAAIREGYLFGGHVVLVLSPGEERPYLGLVKIMHLDGPTYHAFGGRLGLTDGPDVPPAPMRTFLRADAEAVAPCGAHGRARQVERAHARRRRRRRCIRVTSWGGGGAAASAAVPDSLLDPIVHL